MRVYGLILSLVLSTASATPAARLIAVPAFAPARAQADILPAVLTPAHADILPAVLADTAPNLVANGSFEDLNRCTERAFLCAPSAWFGVMRPNEMDAPETKFGIRSMPIFFDNVLFAQRNLPYTKLLCTVAPGKEYEISCWVYGDYIPFSTMDILLSPVDPSRLHPFAGKTKPTISLTTKDIVEQGKHGWCLVRKRFTVDEPMRFLMVGNLQAPVRYSKKQSEYLAKQLGGSIVFWLDNMRLSAVDSGEVACPLYGATREMLYAEHRRHSKFLFLDTLPADVVPVDTAAPAPVVQALVAAPPVVAPVPVVSDTLYIPGVLFASDSHAVTDAYSHLLDSFIVRIESRLPSRVQIDGYTDNTGAEAHNKTLSRQRAEAIRHYLVEHLPDLESISTSNGYGSLRPVAPNTSAANMARNRRVEIVLFY